MKTFSSNRVVFMGFLLALVFSLFLNKLVTLSATKSNAGSEELIQSKTPEGYLYSLKDDESIEVLGVTLYFEELIIPDIIDGFMVTSIGEKAFSETDLTRIVLPDSILEIGKKAFYKSTLLAEVVLPKNLTIIESKAFSHCKSLSKIVVPDSLTTIGSSAFAYCESLTHVELPDSLHEIENSVFKFCSSLTKLDVPTSVTKIGSFAFLNCSSLTEFVMPEGITEISDNMFWGCTSLSKVVIPDSVSKIDFNAFMGCSSLTQIEIPDSVSTIEHSAFAGCSSLIQIEIPDSIEVINDHTFSECSSLAEIVMHNTTRIGNFSFSKCTSIKEIVIPNSTTEIGGFAFLDCDQLERVTIPFPLTYYGVTPFYGCEALTTVYISNYESIEDIDKNKEVISSSLGMNSHINIYPMGNHQNNKISNRMDEIDVYGSQTFDDNDFDALFDSIAGPFIKELEDTKSAIAYLNYLSLETEDVFENAFSYLEILDSLDQIDDEQFDELIDRLSDVFFYLFHLIKELKEFDLALVNDISEYSEPGEEEMINDINLSITTFWDNIEEQVEDSLDSILLSLGFWDLFPAEQKNILSLTEIHLTELKELFDEKLFYSLEY